MDYRKIGSVIENELKTLWGSWKTEKDGKTWKTKTTKEKKERVKRKKVIRLLFSSQNLCSISIRSLVLFKNYLSSFPIPIMGHVLRTVMYKPRTPIINKPKEPHPRVLVMSDQGLLKPKGFQKAKILSKQLPFGPGP